MRAFLDFEASSFAKESYPIEVAWVFEDRRAESHLIRPLPDWTDWDPRAESVHGITRTELEADGEDVAAVGARLLEVLSEHAIYASSPSWDGKWLSVLLRGAGLPRHALRLKDTDEAQLEAATEALSVLPEADRTAAATAVIARVRRAAASWPIAHRALADARQELQMWLAVREVARHEAANSA